MEKKDIRKNILKIRNEIPGPQRKKADKKILNRLLETRDYEEASYIFSYVNYKSEVDTTEIIKDALAKKKKVAVPKVLDSGYMEFFEISALEELISGYQGILEPDITAKKPISVEQIRDKILVVLPGAAFDKTGNRIGYGGGFYDRYLEKYRKCQLKTIALCYEVQMVEEIPAENFDRKVQCIITEQKLYQKKS